MAIYSQQTQSLSPELLELENDLYKAFERDELRLHFQPQFDCHHGGITGVEALLRWEHRGKPDPTGRLHPSGGGIWPDREHGRMGAAPRHARKPGMAPTDRLALRVAVNLSAVQLEHPDLMDVVAAAPRRHRPAPAALELEITESVVVRESLRGRRPAQPVAPARHQHCD